MVNVVLGGEAAEIGFLLRGDSGGEKDVHAIRRWWPVCWLPHCVKGQPWMDPCFRLSAVTCIGTILALQHFRS